MTKSPMLLAMVAWVVGSAVPVVGQLPSVQLAGDPSGPNPEIIDDSIPGPVWVYVLIHHSTPISGVSFSAPIPECFPGAMYVVDETPFLHVTGNSQTGVTLGFGECLEPPADSYTLVMRIMIIVSNPVSSCCWYYPLPNPETGVGEIEVFDCTDNPVVAQGTPVLVGQGFPPQVRDSYPAPGATGVPLDANLSWVVDWCSVGLGVGWNDIYFGTNSDPPLVAANSENTTYDPGPLSPGQTYYWKLQVVDTDAPGGPTVTPAWDFTTGAAIPVHNSTWGAIKALYQTR